MSLATDTAVSLWEAYNVTTPLARMVGDTKGRIQAMLNETEDEEVRVMLRLQLRMVLRVEAAMIASDRPYLGGGNV